MKDSLDEKSNWERLLNKPNLSLQEKQVLVLQEAEKMEQKALRKERLKRVQGQLADTDEDIDEFYIQAIKAKISLLEN